MKIPQSIVAFCIAIALAFLAGVWWAGGTASTLEDRYAVISRTMAGMTADERAAVIAELQQDEAEHADFATALEAGARQLREINEGRD